MNRKLKKIHLAKIKFPLKGIMQYLLCFDIFTMLVDEKKLLFHSLQTLLRHFLLLQWANNHQLFCLWLFENRVLYINYNFNSIVAYQTYLNILWYVFRRDNFSHNVSTLIWTFFPCLSCTLQISFLICTEIYCFSLSHELGWCTETNFVISCSGSPLLRNRSLVPHTLLNVMRMFSSKKAEWFGLLFFF